MGIPTIYAIRQELLFHGSVVHLVSDPGLVRSNTSPFTPTWRRFQPIQHARRDIMQVSEAMSINVRVANPNQTIRDAARLMAHIDAGVLPVGENDHLVGMITDRDIAIRAVGAGKSPDTPIREIMSEDVKYCFEDDDLDEVAQNMADIKVRRLPVLDRDKRLVGILSLGDIALTDGPANAGSALCGICEPGGEHSQSTNGARGAAPEAPG
jgi:CBS domain-containing protein